MNFRDLPWLKSSLTLPRDNVGGCGDIGKLQTATATATKGLSNFPLRLAICQDFLSRLRTLQWLLPAVLLEGLASLRPPWPLAPGPRFAVSRVQRVFSRLWITGQFTDERLDIQEVEGSIAIAIRFVLECRRRKKQNEWIDI